MQEYNKTILSTRPVDESLVKEAQLNGIALDQFSFIETEAISDIVVQQEIEQAATRLATVVFTSMNAVEAVTAMLDTQVPDWSIYCIGHRTKELVENYFGEASIAGTADSAFELANDIIDDGIDEVFFFCGNRRRNELPDKLEENDIVVNEVIVYQTKTVLHHVEKVYDAVLFFSPSAAESFFRANKLPAHAIVFVIGNTTKVAVKKYCNNKIIVSSSPVKDELVEQSIMYLKSITH